MSACNVFDCDWLVSVIHSPDTRTAFALPCESPKERKDR